MPVSVLRNLRSILDHRLARIAAPAAHPSFAPTGFRKKESPTSASSRSAAQAAGAGQSAGRSLRAPSLARPRGQEVEEGSPNSADLSAPRRCASEDRRTVSVLRNLRSILDHRLARIAAPAAHPSFAPTGFRKKYSPGAASSRSAAQAAGAGQSAGRSLRAPSLARPRGQEVEEGSPNSADLSAPRRCASSGKDPVSVLRNLRSILDHRLARIAAPAAHPSFAPTGFRKKESPTSASSRSAAQAAGAGQSAGRSLRAPSLARPRGQEVEEGSPNSADLSAPRRCASEDRRTVSVLRNLRSILDHRLARIAAPAAHPSF